MTFRELLQEERDISAKHYLDDATDAIERAAIRFANNQTEELQAKIMDYRQRFVMNNELGLYDNHFGIQTVRK